MSNSEHKHAQHGSHVMSDDTQSQSMDHAMHHEHAGHDMAEHASHAMHDMHMDHTDHKADSSHTEHSEHAHHADHTGHEQMFRSRFWGSLLLSIPVLVFSPMIQELLGLRIPSFPGS
ncbi:MAG TPA: heavy metal translocating P-type ATPase, partial [Candidatus Paceibacterota bacterium]